MCDVKKGVKPWKVRRAHFARYGALCFLPRGLLVCRFHTIPPFLAFGAKTVVLREGDGSLVMRGRAVDVDDWDLHAIFGLAGRATGVYACSGTLPPLTYLFSPDGNHVEAVSEAGDRTAESCALRSLIEKSQEGEAAVAQSLYGENACLLCAATVDGELVAVALQRCLASEQRTLCNSSAAFQGWCSQFGIPRCFQSKLFADADLLTTLESFLRNIGGAVLLEWTDDSEGTVISRIVSVASVRARAEQRVNDILLRREVGVADALMCEAPLVAHGVTQAIKGVMTEGLPEEQLPTILRKCLSGDSAMLLETVSIADMLRPPIRYLILLCGIAGTGKTTFALSLAQALQHRGGSTILVRGDEVLKSVRERFDGATRHQWRHRVRRELLLEEVRQLGIVRRFLSFVARLPAGQKRLCDTLVIVDNEHLTVESRRRVRREFDARSTFIVSFFVPPGVAHWRALSIRAAKCAALKADPWKESAKHGSRGSAGTSCWRPPTTEECDALFAINALEFSPLEEAARVAERALAAPSTTASAFALDVSGCVASTNALLESFIGESREVSTLLAQWIRPPRLIASAAPWCRLEVEEAFTTEATTVAIDVLEAAFRGEAEICGGNLRWVHGFFSVGRLRLRDALALRFWVCCPISGVIQSNLGRMTKVEVSPFLVYVDTERVSFRVCVENGIAAEATVDLWKRQRRRCREVEEKDVRNFVEVAVELQCPLSAVIRPIER